MRIEGFRDIMGRRLKSMTGIFTILHENCCSAHRAPAAGRQGSTQARIKEMALPATNEAEQGRAHFLDTHRLEREIVNLQFQSRVQVRSEERRVGKECRSRW